MLVEPMDTSRFTELYSEYRGLYGCRQLLETVLTLVGSSPGYLREICSLDSEELERYVEAILRDLETVLAAAIRELGFEPRIAVEATP